MEAWTNPTVPGVFCIDVATVNFVNFRHFEAFWEKTFPGDI